jgi:hypothetical protein
MQFLGDVSEEMENDHLATDHDVVDDRRRLDAIRRYIIPPRPKCLQR